MIKIDFEFDTAHGIFRDALYLPENHNYSEEEIESFKYQRRDNWVAVVTVPNTEPVPTPTVEIAGETYQVLEGVPLPGANLIELNGTWYYKV